MGLREPLSRAGNVTGLIPKAAGLAVQIRVSQNWTGVIDDDGILEISLTTN